MRLPITILCAALAGAACDDAPRDVPPATTAASGRAAGALPSGHPGLDAPPSAGHPGVDGAPAAEAFDDPSRFAGRAVLKGKLAEARSGSLMVMLRPRGQRFPIWAYVVDIGSADAPRQGLAPAVDGQRVLTFVLSKDTTLMPSAIPAETEFEVAVTFDPDGDVDTRDGQATGVAPARAGDDALLVELELPERP